VVWQDQAQRPDDVRRGFQERFAFHQGLANKREIIMLEIAQAAMNQLRAGGRCVRGEVIFLAQQDLKAATRCVACNAGAIDAASNDQDVVQV